MACARAQPGPIAEDEVKAVACRPCEPQARLVAKRAEVACQQLFTVEVIDRDGFHAFRQRPGLDEGAAAGARAIIDRDSTPIGPGALPPAGKPLLQARENRSGVEPWRHPAILRIKFHSSSRTGETERRD